MMLNTAPAFASAPTTTLQGYYGNMDHQHQQHEQRSQQRMRRKRKADNDAGNERLSKRMSLLNLGMHCLLCGPLFRNRTSRSN